MAFRFEQLEIWRLGIEFADDVYGATSGFPKSEVFGLRSDVRRAANSIPMNIGEGSGRGSRRDFSRFFDTAMGSIHEVVTRMAIALKRGYISPETNQKTYTKAEVLAKKVSRFQQSLTSGRKQEA